MKLIVGLGNPEQQYQGTRHNIGFLMLDKYADAKKLQYQSKSRFKGMTAEGEISGEKVILLKPETYYNLSGEAVRAIADFYKISSNDILIVHDEMMLPLGTLRTRQGGSDAGNNGIKSISQHLTPDTARLRIGISQPLRDMVEDKDFVLGKLNQTEKQQLDKLTPTITSIIDSFAAGRFDPSTYVHTTDATS